MRKLDINNQAGYADVDTIPFEQTLGTMCDHFQRATCDISLALIDDATMHELNRRFLNHDEPTDVLTFPGPSTTPGHLEGEILISTDTAARCAGELGISVDGEILLYFIHGVLHLLGYDDQQPVDAARMREMERLFLEQAGFAYQFDSNDVVDEA